MISSFLARSVAVLPLAFVSASLAYADAVFPASEWAVKTPEECGVDGAALDAVAGEVGGRGCVIKDGCIVKSWGDLAQRGDWYSSAKPVLSTLLFFAVEEGRVKDVDQPIADFGWQFKPKDATMTFRHLGSMSSGYARPEEPGEAWSYNDFAIQLYQMTLFDKVFKADAKAVAEDPARLGALGFQDGLEFNSKRRLKASVRDFARIVWFWLNKGRWNGRVILPAHYFDAYMRPQAPKDLPQTAAAETDDYLGIGSYGGGSDHFSAAGPGIYGFNWWFNDTGRLHRHALTWPDAPRDTIMSVGARGNCAAFIPSLNIALVCADGDWGEIRGGDRGAKMNRVLSLLAQTAGYAPDPVLIAGDLTKWQPVTLSFRGEDTSETAEVNPFTDFRLSVTFTHGDHSIAVPGFYAADGNAAESGADAGGVWRVHFAPDIEGEWTYRISFREGTDVALSQDANAGTPAKFDGLTGAFTVGPADSDAPGFLAKGLLRHVGGRYLQFAETGEYFLKGGADSPENLLAFADFDGTTPSHQYAPHAGDWRFGDPVWHGGKGKSLVGALNYLASTGMNSVYFLTMNVGGDGKDVWPWTSDGERSRFDCSKLDQWEFVFSHMDRLSLMMHVILQEQENDQLLDDGELGPQRRLYLRELIARFAHHPALVWNLGEENTNTTAQRRAFAEYIRNLDPYDHPIVIHTFPSKRDEVYSDLLGYAYIDGPSLQLGDMRETYHETRKWVERSGEAGRQWFVCLDEIGPPDTGVVPDSADAEHNDVRQHALWGNLMAGGAGCEWYLGYEPRNDIRLEDWRTRDAMWNQTRFALEFFHTLPFAEMTAVDGVVASGDGWCFANPPNLYAVYAPVARDLRLSLPRGTYSLAWYDPRNGGELHEGGEMQGGDGVAPAPPPSSVERDWALILRRLPE